MASLRRCQSSVSSIIASFAECCTLRVVCDKTDKLTDVWRWMMEKNFMSGQLCLAC